MITAFNARQGTFIKFKNDVYEVVQFEFIKMQQRKPVVKLTCKSVSTGRVVEFSFSSDDTLEDLTVYRKKAIFSYKNNEFYVFLDSETYEELYVQSSLVKNAEFIGESTEVFVLVRSDTEEIIGVELPPTVDLKVIYTEKGIKGDTATSPTKPATLETNYVVQVPLFIEIGDIVRIDTRTGKYIERVKKK